MANIHFGDVFVVQTNQPIISDSIMAVEKFWSKDGKATYSHAGIITSNTGTTIEALWSVKENHLSSYDKCKILIARPIQTVDQYIITDEMRKAAISEIIRRYYGQKYPIWRLALHLIPPLARKIGRGRYLVCSELVAAYLLVLGARDMPYMGVNPDTLADEWIRWKNFEIIRKVE